jgi:hypothetical protein
METTRRPNFRLILAELPLEVFYQWPISRESEFLRRDIGIPDPSCLTLVTYSGDWRHCVGACNLTMLLLHSYSFPSFSHSYCRGGRHSTPVARYPDPCDISRYLFLMRLDELHGQKRPRDCALGVVGVKDLARGSDATVYEWNLRTDMTLCLVPLLHFVFGSSLGVHEIGPILGDSPLSAILTCAEDSHLEQKISEAGRAENILKRPLRASLL